MPVKHSKITTTMAFIQPQLHAGDTLDCVRTPASGDPTGHAPEAKLCQSGKVTAELVPPWGMPCVLSFQALQFSKSWHNTGAFLAAGFLLMRIETRVAGTLSLFARRLCTHHGLPLQTARALDSTKQWLPRTHRTLASSPRAVMAENGRGAFVLFEGVDKSGKTTQCRGLVDHLNSDKVC